MRKYLLLLLTVICSCLSICAQKPEMTSVTPAAGSVLAQMPEKITVTFSSNDSIGYGQWRVVDLNPTNPDEAVITLGQMKPDGDSWVCKVYYYETMKLYEGHTYQFEAYPYVSEDICNTEQSQYANAIGKYTITWTGSTQGYRYSDVVLKSLSPADGSVIESGDIVAVFSAPVTITSAKINYGLMGDNVSCPRQANGDMTEWIISIPEKTLNASTGSLNLNVVVKDSEGLVVKGNVGEEDNSYFEWSYNCYLGVPDLVISPASGSTVQQISKLIVTNSAPINFSYQASEKITVLKDGAVIATIADEQVEISEAGNSATITLVEPITEAGDYQVVIPSLYFILGEQFESVMNKKQVVNLTVGGAPTVSVSPEDGSVLSSMQYFHVVFTDKEKAVPTWERNATLVNAATGALVGQLDCTKDVAANGVSFFLDEAFNVNGTYNLVIPEGVVSLNDGASVNKAMTFTYIIEGGVDGTGGSTDPGTSKYKFTTTPEVGSNLEMLDCVSIAFTDAIAANFEYDKNPYVLNEAGQIVAEATYEWGEQLNELLIKCNPITASGKYTVVLPKGSVILDENETTEDIYLVYKVNYVDDEPVLAITTSPAAGSTIELLDKVDMTFDEYETADYNHDMTPFITDENNEKVDVVCGCEWGEMYNELVFTCTPIAQDGTYTIHFPAGYFILDNEANKEEITLTYTIKAPVFVDGITSLSCDKAGVRYNIAGQHASTNTHGVIIVNGKKVVRK